MAKIAKEHRGNFTPTINTFIGGKRVSLTIKQLESEPFKYINTPVGYMYENSEAIKRDLAQRTNAPKPVRLDMNKQKRGRVFAKASTTESIEAFKAKQAKRRAKLQLLSKSKQVPAKSKRGRKPKAEAPVKVEATKVGDNK